ncbi:hypothetical protein F4802DRAFT_602475 [Xylaria palmicola]|nr:hypothetical protein F4802DRAFT_602475 [Xylaria palmicola]
MDSARKIELQVPEDLAYLVANVRRAAAARIDEAFPPVVDDDTEDELRTQIEALVDEYITKTFTLASPNLTINGLPVDASHFLSSPSSSSPNNPNHPQAPDEVFEAFDARKRARVEALTADEEDLLRDIARLKKTVPLSASAAWAEGFRAGVRADEEALTSQLTTTADADGGAGTKTTRGGDALTIAPLDRQPAVEAAFAAAVAGLGRLKTEMPALVARMERARRAGEYVVTER